MSLILLTSKGGPNKVTILNGNVQLADDEKLQDIVHSGVRCQEIYLNCTSAIERLIDSVFSDTEEDDDLNFLMFDIP